MDDDDQYTLHKCTKLSKNKNIVLKEKCGFNLFLGFSHCSHSAKHFFFILTGSERPPLWSSRC